MGMMPWADDTRCLYCDGKLPLYRKLTQGQFCSKAHQTAYWQEQERLAVERLHQTHDALKAYRPPEPIEAILGPLPLPAFPQTSFTSAPSFDAEAAGGGPAPASEPGIPPLHGALPQYTPVSYQDLADLVAADPVEYEFSCRPLTPRRPPYVVEMRRLASAGAVPCWDGFVAYGPVAVVPPSAEPPEPRLAPAPPEHFVKFAFSPAPTGAVSLPAPQFLPVPLAAPVRGELHPLETRVAPMLRLALGIQPRNDALEDILFERLRLAGRLRLPELAALGAAHALFRAMQPKRVLFSGAVAWPGFPSSPRSTAWAPAPAGLAALANAARPAAAAVLPPRAAVEPQFEPADAWVPGLAASVQRACAPSMAGLQSLAAGARTALAPISFVPPEALEGRMAGLLPVAQIPGHTASAPQPCAPALASLQILTAGARTAPSPLSAPARPLERSLAAVLPVRQGTTIAAAECFLPAMAGLRPLAVAAKVPGAVPPPVAEPEIPSRPAALAAPSSKPAAVLALRARATKLLRLAYRDRMQPVSALAPLRPLNAAISHGPHNEPILPDSRLEPLADKPLADLFRARRRGPLYPLLHPSVMLAPALDFWRNGPRDLKLLLFAIPVLIALVFHPALPKVSVKVPDTSVAFAGEFKQAVNAQLASLRQSVLDRAAVALDEDFRQGLDAWTSRGGATAEWSFDETGFVQPGPLALYAPSMRLTDYQMQFLGMIDQGALSWVVRAADFQNYYVIRLVTLRSGPIPAIGLQRYAVIDGKAQDRVDTPVPVSARDQMQFRVRLDVNGDHFALQVQGQMVDSWTEKRLKRGGIGFFTLRGERSRVRWVQLTHQYDVLGRLCAYLAPYDLTTTTGSW
jgi:hypothetical protein